METPEGEALTNLVRALAQSHGVPCGEGELPQLVEAFRTLMVAVRTLDSLPLPDDCEPAPVYEAAPRSAQ